MRDKAVGSILIVDDQESIRFAMTEYLEGLGFLVDSASGAAQASRLADARSYTVVVADLRLAADHQDGGLELLARVRTRSPRTRTVLLTAYGSSETEREVRRIGIDALLLKSQRLSEIAAKLAELCAGSS